MYSKGLPKLPTGSYKLPLNDFLKVIWNYHPTIKKNCLRLYIALIKSRKSRRALKNNNTENYDNVISEYQKLQVIELAGRLFNPKQILNVIRNDWGKNRYKASNLKTLLTANRNVILQKRMQFTSNIEEVRLVHQRSRLEELSLLYQKATLNNNMNQQLKILKLIKEEVENDKLILDANIVAEVTGEVKGNILNVLDKETVSKIAMMKVLEKHGIEFDSIASRLSSNAKFVNAEEAEYIEIDLIKENKKNEDRKMLKSGEEIKNNLLEKIKRSKKEFEKVNVEVGNIKRKKENE